MNIWFNRFNSLPAGYPAEGMAGRIEKIEKVESVSAYFSTSQYPFGFVLTYGVINNRCSNE